MADKKPSALEPSEVPRPALFGWSIALIVIAAVVWFVAQVMLEDAYDMDERQNAVALASSAIALEGLGWLLFVASCIIHTIRVEAEAIRRKVSVAYGVSSTNEYLPEHVRNPTYTTKRLDPVNGRQRINYRGYTISWVGDTEVKSDIRLEGRSYKSVEQAMAEINSWLKSI